MRNKLTVLKVLVLLCACFGVQESYAQVTIYSQDFEGVYPWGMTTNALNGTTHVWDDGDDLGLSNQAGGTGNFAVANSDYWCDSPWDAELVTPTLNFTTYSNVSLTFDSYFQDYIGSGEIWVDVSTNGGANWITEYTETNDMAVGPITVDLSDYDLTANVKVRFRYSDNNDGCAWYWYIDNIEIEGDLAGACTSPPNAGAAIALSPMVCAGGLANLSLTGNSGGTGQTYQWQSSTDTFVWTNIPGATNAATAQTVTGTTYFRNIVTCSGQSDTSTAVMVETSFMLCYCTPIHDAFGPTDCGIDYTSNVKFGTINNSSTCGGSAPYNFSDYTAISTDVIKGNTYPISITTDGDTEGIGVWIDFDHSGTFDVSEFVLHGYTGDVPETYTGNILIPITALDGPTVMRIRNKYNGDVSAGEACATFSYGEVEHYTINILPPPADEAGVLEITSPAVAACTLGNQLWVNMQNLGSNPLTSATFVVKVNNVNISVANPWTGSIAPGATMEIQVPATYSFADGDSVSITVSNPNGVAENGLFAFNNHVGRRLFAGLSGNKTVYGVGANYPNLNAAIDALVQRGVCDTVYFKIASNTYNTQHNFVPYTGAGPGKLAVFESATGNAGDVVFDYPTAGGSNYVFNFNGGSYYSLRNITAVASGSTYSTAVTFMDNANHVELANNILMGDTAAAYDAGNFDQIVVTTDYNNGTDYDNIWIHDNQIMGGCRSFDLEINDGEYQSNFVIENNTLSKYSVLGILTYNTSGLVFNNNVLRPNENATGEMYGVYLLQGVDGGTVSGNDIAIPGEGMGILLMDVVGGSSPVTVTNNFIYTGDTTANGVSAGITTAINFSGINSVLLANNSISFRSDNTGMAGINVDAGTSISVINNNIASFGDAPALMVSSNNSIGQISHNNLFGSTLATVDGNSYFTLPTLQASAYGANSVSVDPLFNGMDLHTCAPALNAAGTPLPSVVDDFDGDVRGTMPDIGADEFLADANGLLAEDAFLKCPADQVTIGNAPVNGVVYSWTPSGNTSEINTTNAGTFIITATSSCGSFSDTAVVTNKPLPDASFTSASVGLTSIFNNTSTNGTSYSWNFGDGNGSTDMSPSHVYSAAGTYSVTLTVTNDCGTDTFGPTPVNVINAGIEENVDMNVSLFPNPTNGQFTITLSAITNVETTINVIDMTGKTVMVKNIAAGVNQATLDATSFASGIYSVKISNGDFTKVIRLVRR